MTDGEAKKWNGSDEYLAIKSNYPYFKQENIINVRLIVEGQDSLMQRALRTVNLDNSEKVS